MTNTNISGQQGHWILARMGKRVLRPGGKELTKLLIKQLNINKLDDVVEFAPGLGYTARLALKCSPRTYTAVELNEEVAGRLGSLIKGEGRRIVLGHAAQTGLDDAAYSKVYGEAMLSMQADHRKSEIIREAFRLLRKGGLYGIHELGLKPVDIAPDTKADIQLELAEAIQVNARPLTIQEWSDFLEHAGFIIREQYSNPMHLLEPLRLLDDEGWIRTLKIVFNALTHPVERKRILVMRRVFRKYRNHLNAVCIVAEKN